MTADDIAGTDPYARLRFDGQYLVVTGAGSGVGAATAALLRARGATLLLVDRDADALTGVGQRLDAATLPADVTDRLAVATIAQTTSDWPALHGLLNCVGITGETHRPTHEVDIDDFEHVVATNLRSAFLLTRALVPRMLEAGYGRIVHVASIAGKEGNAGMAAYSATKAGLIGLVKAAGKDYATSGVTVNAIAPAVIRTPLVEAMPPEQVTYMTSRIPMQRCGTLAEVAELAAFVLSPAASFTTGFTWDMSGGRATY
jgi:2-dehydro-3-deoxy-L-rhamnonate dehydrogenase (NAD+)